MAATKRCKVCGCEYEYCRTNRREGIFRWQDVACSPEHGAVYFAQIAASRADTVADAVDPIATFDNALLSELDEDDSSFDDDFDDSEEEIDIEQ